MAPGLSGETPEGYLTFVFAETAGRNLCLTHPPQLRYSVAMPRRIPLSTVILAGIAAGLLLSLLYRS